MNNRTLRNRRFLQGFGVLVSVNLALLLLRAGLNGGDSSSSVAPTITATVAATTTATATQAPEETPVPAIVPTNSKATETATLPVPSPSPLPASPSPTAAGPIAHVIQPGETLESIAVQYNVTTAAIIAENDIEDPDLIIVGTTLIIPVQDSPGPE